MVAGIFFPLDAENGEKIVNGTKNNCGNKFLHNKKKKNRHSLPLLPSVTSDIMYLRPSKKHICLILFHPVLHQICLKLVLMKVISLVCVNQNDTAVGEMRKMKTFTHTFFQL